jgi:hypothetical protein
MAGRYIAAILQTRPRKPHGKAKVEFGVLVVEPCWGGRPLRHRMCQAVK